jgi:hypothetical protein
VKEFIDERRSSIHKSVSFAPVNESPMTSVKEHVPDENFESGDGEIPMVLSGQIDANARVACYA